MMMLNIEMNHLVQQDVLHGFVGTVVPDVHDQHEVGVELLSVETAHTLILQLSAERVGPCEPDGDLRQRMLEAKLVELVVSDSKRPHHAV